MPKPTTVVDIQVGEVERQHVQHTAVDQDVLVVIADQVVRRARHDDSGVETAELELPQALFAAAVGKRDQRGHLDAPCAAAFSAVSTSLRSKRKTAISTRFFALLMAAISGPTPSAGSQISFTMRCSPPSRRPQSRHRLRCGHLGFLGTLDPVAVPHTRRCAAMSASCVPCSASSESFTTKMTSAWRIVARWCAMTMDVLPFIRRVQGLDHGLLGRGVQPGGRLVQNQNGRVADDRPRDGDALALTAGERHAALADHRVVAVGHLLDELVGVGQFGGAPDLSARGARACRRRCSPRSVARNSSVSCRTKLICSRSDFNRVPADVRPVDVDFPGHRIVEARNQADDGRLAAPVGPTMPRPVPARS